MERLKQLVSDREHRQEIVTNGPGPCPTSMRPQYIKSDPCIDGFLDFLERIFRLGNRGDEFCSHLSMQGQSYNSSTEVTLCFQDHLRINYGSELGQPSDGPGCLRHHPINGQESSLQFKLDFLTNRRPGKHNRLISAQ